MLGKTLFVTAFHCLGETVSNEESQSILKIIIKIHIIPEIDFYMTGWAISLVWI